MVLEPSITGKTSTRCERNMRAQNWKMKQKDDFSTHRCTALTVACHQSMRWRSLALLIDS